MGESEQVPGPDQDQDQGWAQQEIKVQLYSGNIYIYTRPPAHTCPPATWSLATISTSQIFYKDALAFQMAVAVYYFVC